jgi:hypothetical protein
MRIENIYYMDYLINKRMHQYSGKLLHMSNARHDEDKRRLLYILFTNIYFCKRHSLA